MTIPDTISVMGQRVKIVVKDELTDSDGSELYGHIDKDKMVIELSKKQTSQQMVRTLLHEVIHCCLFIGGLSEILSKRQEEAVCRCLEHGLGPLVNLRPKRSQRVL